MSFTVSRGIVQGEGGGARRRKVLCDIMDSLVGSRTISHHGDRDRGRARGGRKRGKGNIDKLVGNEKNETREAARVDFSRTFSSVWKTFTHPPAIPRCVFRAHRTLI